MNEPTSDNYNMMINDKKRFKCVSEMTCRYTTTEPKLANTNWHTQLIAPVPGILGTMNLFRSISLLILSNVDTLNFKYTTNIQRDPQKRKTTSPTPKKGLLCVSMLDKQMLTQDVHMGDKLEEKLNEWDMKWIMN